MITKKMTASSRLHHRRETATTCSTGRCFMIRFMIHDTLTFHSHYGRARPACPTTLAWDSIGRSCISFATIRPASYCSWADLIRGYCLKRFYLSRFACDEFKWVDLSFTYCNLILIERSPSEANQVQAFSVKFHRSTFGEIPGSLLALLTRLMFKRQIKLLNLKSSAAMISDWRKLHIYTLRPDQTSRLPFIRSSLFLG